MTTETTEKGTENLIVSAMTGQLCVFTDELDIARLQCTAYGYTGWIYGDPQDYDRG